MQSMNGRRAAWAHALSALCLCSVALLSACGRPGGEAPAATGEPPVLSLGREDVLTVGAREAAAPVLTGTIQAERRADLRAEVGAVVLRVLRDNGEAVKKGELLVKLDDTALRDALTSAEEALRAADRSAEGADRQYQRLKSLQAQGMTSVQALEDAEVRRNLAQSEQVAAKSRVTNARQQLERTEVRAPFDGLMSARKVSPGDTAGVGKELVQVIDPGSLRMEAFVSADRVGELRVGQVVRVRVQGRASGLTATGTGATAGAAGAAPGAAAAPTPDASLLEGRIRRIDAVAQPITRQVAVVVDLQDAAGRRPAGLIAGLYAEGTVEVPAPSVLAIPDTAVVRQGDQTLVWRLQDQTLKRQAVTLQPRDPRTGLFTVSAGLSAGDRILRSPGSRPVEGQRFTVRGS